MNDHTKATVGDTRAARSEVQAEEADAESSTKLQAELELPTGDAVEPPSPYLPSISTGRFGIYLYPAFSGMEREISEYEFASRPKEEKQEEIVNDDTKATGGVARAGNARAEEAKSEELKSEDFARSAASNRKYAVDEASESQDRFVTSISYFLSITIQSPMVRATIF